MSPPDKDCGADFPVGQVAGRKTRPTSILREALVFMVLSVCAGCGALPGVPLPNESTQPVDNDRFDLLARFVHITDAHLTDEESPGRLTAAAAFSTSAWRPHEAYSTQLLDGTIRTINKMHVAQHTIDFVIHTGDATDNAQLNELQWFVTVMSGGRIDPRTGPDDRDPASLPDPLLDPHHPFDAQGLYQHGVHGGASTIPWYSLLGNHDRFALGVFPIVTDVFGRRTSPLPLANRIALTFPVVLDPTGSLSWAPITPASPGPPPQISLPVRVEPNPERCFITDRDFVEAHLEGAGEPPGHGFDVKHLDRTWYSVSPVPGLRLIALNSASPLIEQPTLVYSEGAISIPQVQFLKRELEQAQSRGDCVVVATHHPSGALELASGTALTPRSIRKLLNDYPCVKLHIAGHWHENLVIDHGGYIEMVTSSILDPPQQSRIIEIWRSREASASAGADTRIQQSEPWASARADNRTPVQHTSSVDVYPSRERERPVNVNPTLALGARINTAAVGSEQTDTDQEIELRYWMFSHLDEINPPDESHAALFDDPLMSMRRAAAELAGVPTPEPRAEPIPTSWEIRADRRW